MGHAHVGPLHSLRSLRRSLPRALGVTGGKSALVRSVAHYHAHMDLIPVASSAAKWFLGWLPAALLRWYYTPQRLARLMYVDILPRNQSVWLNLAPAADFRIAMQVINLSPFQVEIDRAKIELLCGTAPLEATNLERRSVEPGEIATVYFSQVIPDGHANQIHKNIDGNSPSLNGLFQFNCRVQAFSRVVPNLSGLPVTVVNRHLRGDA